MTTKYGDYKEYHTSLDKLDLTVDSKGLFRGYKLIARFNQFNRERNFSSQ